MKHEGMGQDSSSKHSIEDSRAPGTLTILSNIRWETQKHWDTLINTGLETDKKAHSQELTGWHTSCAASSLLKAADLLHGPGVLASGSSRTCPGLLSVVLPRTWKTAATTHLLSLGNWYGIFPLILKSEPMSCVSCHDVSTSCLFSSFMPNTQGLFFPNSLMENSILDVSFDLLAGSQQFHSAYKPHLTH